MITARRFWLSALPTLVLLAIGFYLLAPTRIGGFNTYSIVSGNSMYPKFHGGDLVIARRSGAPSVGQIVVYRSPTLNRLVVHRVHTIAADGTFFAKGDHNTFIDPGPLSPSTIQGHYLYVVPGLGRGLHGLGKPLPLGLIVGLAAFLLVGVSPGRRRRGGPMGAPGADGPQELSAPTLLRLSGLILLVLGAALVMIGWTASAQRLAESPDLTSVTGSVSWRADVTPGPVYQSSTVSQPQALFLRSVRSAELAFSGKISSREPINVHGTGTLDLVLSDGQGWSSTIPVAARTAFSGSSFTLRGTISPRALRARADRFLAATGSAVDTFTLTVRPSVHVVGTVGRNALDRTVSPTVALQMDRTRIASRPSSSGAPGSLTATTSIPGIQAVSAAVALGPVTTSRVRVASIGALLALLGAGLLIVGFAALRRDPGADASEAAWISSRYGSWLVPVVSLELNGDAVVRVERFAELVRLADQFGRPILERHVGDRVQYTVRHDSTAYVYSSGRRESLPSALDDVAHAPVLHDVTA